MRCLIFIAVTALFGSAPPEDFSDTRRRRVVSDVIDVANALETSLVVSELVEVERFWLVEHVAVSRPHLVRVKVSFSSPCRAVPQLPVTLIACHQVVRVLLDI